MVNGKSGNRVLVVGSGFAGLAMGIRLKQAGFDDFTILERSGEVGGTWLDNSYPGAGCDVESHLYSLSFEPNAKWTRAFAPQKEILEYLVHCADKYDVRRHVRFHAGVERARFDEAAATWHVDIAGGERLSAAVLVAGCGPLNRPSTPDIAGLDTFAGKTFHSSRWDHSVPLDGKRVAVIGTGASAIQIVPAIAPTVERLYVYQRTAPWIVPKPDRAFGPIERSLYARVPALQRMSRYWIYLQRELLGLGFGVEPRILALAERMARRYLAKSVADGALRAKLAPDYRMGCKRILPTNDWYPTLQRPNVELVTDRIERVLPGAVATTDGRTREVDAVVLATGFMASEQVAPFEVRGRGGRDLGEAWSDGAEAYLGSTISGFPNLFLIVGPNTGLGHTSMVVMIESQVRYVVDAIRTMRERGLATVDVRPDAQASYNARIQERLARTVWASGCKSWYLTRTGKNTTLWPGSTVEFAYRTRRFDADAYDVERSSAARPGSKRGARPFAAEQVAHAALDRGEPTRVAP
jgi:cation diffusion facilitator CzcD-associated flavoprotein CzcO